LKHETLRLWFRNREGEPWAKLGEPVRAPSASPAQCTRYDVSDTLSFTTTHFTEFALFAEGAYKVHLPLTSR
jgi:hypothetical protein